MSKCIMSFTTKVLENRKYRPVKVQIVSRNFPVGLPYGCCVYVLDFVRYLQKVGFEIEFILLNSSLGDKGLFIILSEVEDINFVVRDNFRVGRFLLRSRSWIKWITTSPLLVYGLLAVNKLKSIYRSAKKRLQQMYGYGRACVSTTVGVQGLRDVADSAVLVADTAEDFAAAVRLLLTNPGKRQSMEEQACKYVTEQLSPQIVYQPFVERIHQHFCQIVTKLNRGLPLSTCPQNRETQ